MKSGITRRAALAAICAFPLFFGTTATASSYPDRPITWIVPQTPGGGSDIVTRAVAHEVSRVLGQPIIIENRAGAGGNIGTAAAARVTPDGYTLLMNSVNHVINPSLYKNAGYDPGKDFIPVAMMATGNIMLAVEDSHPAKNLQEFLELVRKSGDPTVYASPGNGSVNHLAIVLLGQQAELNLEHIPYKGAPAASNALVGKQVQFSFLAPASSAGLIQSGRLRGLGMTSSRIDSMPDVPSIGEIVDGYDVTPWYAIFAPKGTDQKIVERMNKAINEALETPALKEKLAAQGIVASPMSQPDFIKLVDEELKRWSTVVKHSSARVD